MTAMVPNCNTYYHIDYGIPLLFKTPDYRTSNDVGLNYIPAQYSEFEKIKFPVKQKLPLIEPKLDTFKTNYTVAYDWKNQKYDPSRKNYRLGAGNFHFMRTFKEKICQDPVPPRKFDLEEYKDEYCLHPTNDVAPKNKSILNETICNVSSLGRGEQPRIKLEDNGVWKHLDIYISQSHLAHVPFTRDQLKASKHHFLTFYESNKSPELKLKSIRKPINDEIIFKTPIKDRIVLKQVSRVPFSGKTTDYQSNYVDPTTSCFYTQIFDPGLDFEDSLSNPNKKQTLAAPNMYCTDYCHIGTGRHIKAAVPQRKKKQFVHDGCPPRKFLSFK